MKKILIIVGCVVGVVVIAAACLPFLINADSFRPRVESEMRSALGRQVSIGHMELALLSGGLKANDISIADDPAFSRSPFLQAKSLQVSVDLPALIFSRQLSVRGFTLDQPQVTLLHTAAGKWNFSSLGASQTKTKSGGSPAALSVDSLEIKNGRLAVGKVGGKLQTYDGVNLTARNVSFDKAFPFAVDTSTPGGGSVKIEGNAGPVNHEDASATPFDAQVTTKNLDLASTGFVPADSGLRGKVDYSGKIHSDGAQVHSQGEATATQLQLVKGGAPSKQPVKIDHVADYDLKKQTGTLSKGDVRTGNTAAHMTGNFDARGENAVLHMKINGKDMPIQDVAGLLPALGVTLPAGSSLQGGTATADLDVDGPVDKLVTAGTLDVANVKLAGFNLGSKMSAIAALAGIHATPDTNIQAMSSKLRIAPEGIRADSLTVIVPEIGTVTGAGTIAANNALNFKMLAKINQSATNVMGNLTRIASLNQSASKGIPFRIQGTTSNPVFVPDVGGMLGNQVQAPVQGVQGLGGVLGGIFGKKKKPQQ
ncbi:MAG TPA: AsmA family protein [Terriglobales bacterium]|nr:AsmA family protein [Terriglobales bacterium]